MNSRWSPLYLFFFIVLGATSFRIVAAHFNDAQEKPAAPEATQDPTSWLHRDFENIGLEVDMPGPTKTSDPYISDIDQSDIEYAEEYMGETPLVRFDVNRYFAKDSFHFEPRIHFENYISMIKTAKSVSNIKIVDIRDSNWKDRPSVEMECTFEEAGVPWRLLDRVMLAKGDWVECCVMYRLRNESDGHGIWMRMLRSLTWRDRAKHLPTAPGPASPTLSKA